MALTEPSVSCWCQSLKPGDKFFKFIFLILFKLHVRKSVSLEYSEGRRLDLCLRCRHLCSLNRATASAVSITVGFMAGSSCVQQSDAEVCQCLHFMTLPLQKHCFVIVFLQNIYTVQKD